LNDLAKSRDLLFARATSAASFQGGSLLRGRFRCSEVQSIGIMTITTREVSHITIVDITGRITLGDETGQLRDAIQKLLAEGKKKIILNLAQVDYIDSSAVGELVSGFTSARAAGGELKLLSLTKKVHDIVQVTKLYTVFDIKDDEFTAIKSFDYFFAK
jgi:anti-sigma B factor antagonist